MLTPRLSNKLLINHKAKLVAALDNAEAYRCLAVWAKDRGERESYERIAERCVESLRNLRD
jgi:3-methyladenine DNA glycosylase Tag